MLDTSTAAKEEEWRSFKIGHENTKQLKSMHSPYQGSIRESIKMMPDKKSIGSSSENKIFKSNGIYYKTEFQFTRSHVN